MNKGIYVATSGSLAQERAMDIISNNMANMNTTGFKADRMLFQTYLPKTAAAVANAPTSDEIKAGITGNKTDDIAYMFSSQSYTNFEQGALQKTGNTFDIALDGNGFMAVETPTGERYTRGGAFKIDSAGQLVTADGYKVLGHSGSPITVGNEEFSVRDDGLITVSGGGTEQLKIVDFADRSQLKKSGQGFFVAEEGMEPAEPTAKVRQGYLEASNINPVAEMTRMITALRTYEAFQKSIYSNDDMTTRLITDVARP